MFSSLEKSVDVERLLHSNTSEIEVSKKKICSSRSYYPPEIVQINISSEQKAFSETFAAKLTWNDAVNAEITENKHIKKLFYISQ